MGVQGEQLEDERAGRFGRSSAKIVGGLHLKLDDVARESLESRCIQRQRDIALRVVGRWSVRTNGFLAVLTWYLVLVLANRPGDNVEQGHVDVRLARVQGLPVCTPKVSAHRQNTRTPTRQGPSRSTPRATGKLNLEVDDPRARGGRH